MTLKMCLVWCRMREVCSSVPGHLRVLETIQQESIILCVSPKELGTEPRFSKGILLTDHSYLRLRQTVLWCQSRLIHEAYHGFESYTPGTTERWRRCYAAC